MKPFESAFYPRFCWRHYAAHPRLLYAAPRHQSIDTAVSTWTLCSIPDADRALQEIRRVLTPSGRLLFVEHGLAPEPGVRRWQDRLTPAWCCVSGGCHLNRPIRSLIERAGFGFDQIGTGYAPGPRCFTYFYEGVARKC
ncbi:methyltransferase domain-containing protein [Burkholderia contaminans]|uniref:class I SAM-dependent methyltransferase n=1 Tax=Burkholderia contaminans TaxID=488447 RepID=UPI00214F8643|nr:methyltransferase domain-containing protein [Burkholderia contaminans]UUX43137.1 methyltransferase domain-containing protein [Burkholderia contaminans]